MNSRGNDALRNLLAAEYVLGTLGGPARRRFETWLRDDAELRALVSRWQAHFEPLSEMVPERAPPARVWDGLVQRLPVLAPETAPSSGWIQSLAFWRGLAGALAVLAVLAVALPLYRTPGSSPTTAQSGAPYIATIEEDKTHRPVALMIMPAEGDEVVLQLVDAQGPVPSDHVLQLWMANPSGPGVVSAGLAPQGAGAEPVRFKVPDPARLRASPVVALSLEPAGGSPSATHVLGLGKWSKPAT